MLRRVKGYVLKELRAKMIQDYACKANSFPKRPAHRNKQKILPGHGRPGIQNSRNKANEIPEQNMVGPETL
jgi:hypothetical protein